MNRLLCLIGFHQWVYDGDRVGSGYWSHIMLTRHYCRRCNKDHR